MNRYKEAYKHIVENSPNGIVYFDLEGNVHEVNNSFLKIFGATAEMFKNFNVLRDVKDKKLKSAIKKAIRTGSSSFSDWYITIVSGKKIYIDMIFKGIYENGKMTFILATVNDKTKEIILLEELKRSQKEWKSIIDNMLNGFIQTDKDGKILKASPSLKEILGYEMDELIGKEISSFWPKYEIANIYRQAYLKDPKPTRYKEIVFLDKSGKKVILNGSISPRFDKEGNYIGSDNFIEDVTDSVDTKKTLHLYKKIIENTSEGVVITDTENNIIYVNSSFSKITGYSFEEVIGKKPSILKSDIYDKEFYKEMWNRINSLGSWSGEIWNRHKSGRIYPEFLTIDTIKGAANSITHYIAIFTDISEMKKSEEKMKYMAMHDSLTHLPNRLKFESVLKKSIEDSFEKCTKLAILFLDLDNFKMINDNYGHHEGDKVLIETANRLRGLLKDENLFRFGGDEFVIILNNFNSKEEIEELMSAIKAELNKPFKTKNYIHYVSCSVGVSIYPDDAKNFIDLIKHADTAMYDAKKHGKNRFSFYAKTFGDKIEKELQTANLLRDALEREEFEVYYQPKISLKDNRVVGLEALLRWKNSNLGTVSPDDFIPIAEKTQLIIPIGNWVLKKACTEVKELVEKGLYNGTISVNISGIQLNYDDIAGTIKSVVEETKFNANLLDLEITESVLMSNPKRWLDIFNKIKVMGIDISIDDFGTGYSSLSYLKEFPIDEIKIDKSFIDDLPYNKDSCILTKTIILLAKSLGFKIVAEGVEKEEHMEFLKEEGCDIIQGFYYSKPLNYDGLKEYLSSFPKTV